MARMPGAKWSGEHSPRNKMQRYDIVCIHTIVGYAPAHAAHFSTSGGGTIWQSRDTKYRSAANLNGNHRIIAIENADHGAGFPSWSGDNVPPFTPQQIEAIAKILAWAHKTHGIPLVMAPNSKPGSRGIAYHRQGIDGNFGGYKYGGRVPGGEVWTESYGKVCPGDARIAQIPQIIARARVIAGLEEDDDMPSAEAIAEAIWKYKIKDPIDGKMKPASTLLKGARKDSLRALTAANRAGDHAHAGRDELSFALDETLDTLEDMPRAVMAYQAKDDKVSFYTRQKRIAESLSVPE